LSSKFAKLGPALVPHRGVWIGPSQIPIQILRLGGIIHQADSARLPFLLNPADHFTTLIVRHCHEVDLSHAEGIRCLQCELQRIGFVVGSVRALKRLLRDCVTCMKRRLKATITQMATIPAYRIPDESKTRPSAFEIITLDACGPWENFAREGQCQTKALDAYNKRYDVGDNSYRNYIQDGLIIVLKCFRTILQRQKSLHTCETGQRYQLRGRKERSF
jgi:hypothetical protein